MTFQESLYEKMSNTIMSNISKFFPFFIEEKISNFKFEKSTFFIFVQHFPFFCYQVKISKRDFEKFDIFSFCSAFFPFSSTFFAFFLIEEKRSNDMK